MGDQWIRSDLKGNIFDLASLSDISLSESVLAEADHGIKEDISTDKVDQEQIDSVLNNELRDDADKSECRGNAERDDDWNAPFACLRADLRCLTELSHRPDISGAAIGKIITGHQLRGKHRNISDHRRTVKSRVSECINERAAEYGNLIPRQHK